MEVKPDQQRPRLRSLCPPLYRQILSYASDSSTVSVGYLSNLKDLLKSEADQFSSLNGHDLVARNVKKYVCMVSRYPGHTVIGGGNFGPDPEATDYVVHNWPTLTHFTGGGSNGPISGNPCKKSNEC